MNKGHQEMEKEIRTCATCQKKFPVDEMHAYTFGSSTLFECRKCYEKMSDRLDKYSKVKARRRLAAKSFTQ